MNLLLLLGRGCLSLEDEEARLFPSQSRTVGARKSVAKFNALKMFLSPSPRLTHSLTHSLSLAWSQTTPPSHYCAYHVL